MPSSAKIELLSRAIEALRDSTNLSVLTTSLESSSRDSEYDAVLRIGRGNNRTEYAATLKRSLTHPVIGSLVSHIRRSKPRGVLVTHHITPAQADRLRHFNVPFFDTAGNAFFDDPNLFVFVSGRKPDEGKPKDTPSRAFQASGLRTVFALLCNPGLELQPYRNIATAASVSHGTIGVVMSDLEKEGYLIEMGPRGRRLTNKANLIRRWIETYPQQLRSKLLLGRYSSPKSEWWQDARLEPLGAYWGGEVAAAKLTGHLRPEQKTIYADRVVPEILAKFALKKDLNGDLEMLRKFWSFDDESAKNGIVPPLLVYADLIASGDDRNIETAEIIYDTTISRLIGEASTV